MIKTYKIQTQPSGKKHILFKHDGVTVDTQLYWQPSVPLEFKEIPLGYINEDRIKWAEMLNDLLTPGGAIITRMRAAASVSPATATSIQRQTDFTTIGLVMQNGVNGFPDDTTLQSLLRLNWGFSPGEKTAINTYLSNNNFTISI